jgi:hypothetical protein
MKNCPIMAKTSDLKSPTDQKASEKPRYLSPAELAELIGPLKVRANRKSRKRKDCSERTVREWCKKGLIPEADRTSGGHWRISMPLSLKTRYELGKRCADWPFDETGGDFQGDWNAQMAEWLMLAQLYWQRLDEHFPVPTIAELAETLDADRIDHDDEKAKAARQIQDEIIRRLDNRESFSDLLLRGWVYQFWYQEQRRPTVAEIAKFMGLSHYAFYKLYNRQDLYREVRVACGRAQAVNPEELAETANRRARKTNRIGSSQRDPFAEDEDD